MFSPCPTGWKSDPADGVELVRLAVRSGLYPVYEVFDGVRWKVNVRSELSADALHSYVERQGRFKEGVVDEASLRRLVERQWQRLNLMQGGGE